MLQFMRVQSGNGDEHYIRLDHISQVVDHVNRMVIWLSNGNQIVLGCEERQRFMGLLTTMTEGNQITNRLRSTLS